MNKWLVIILPVLLLSCGVKDYNKIPLYSKNHRIQAVVEIPAGTNHQIEYCGVTHRFNLKSHHDNGDVVRFLPYPFNFGFLPSTMMSEKMDETGQPVDVLILSEAVPTGEVVEVLPIGIVTLNKEHGNAMSVIAVPFDESYRIIAASNLEELNDKYPGVIRIIEEWLCYSDPEQITEIISWQDEIMAMRVIEKWAKN